VLISDSEPACHAEGILEEEVLDVEKSMVEAPQPGMEGKGERQIITTTRGNAVVILTNQRGVYVSSGLDVYGTVSSCHVSLHEIFGKQALPLRMTPVDWRIPRVAFRAFTQNFLLPDFRLQSQARSTYFLWLWDINRGSGHHGLETDRLCRRKKA
jgi:hypothetical protein